MSKTSQLFIYFFSLKNRKMGDYLVFLRIFDNFDFLYISFSKNAPICWCSIPNQTKLLEHFYGSFHNLWSCLCTIKLSYAQLFKWGHSKHTNGHQITTELGMYYQNLLVFAQWNLFQWLQVKHHYVQRKICNVHQVLENPEEFFHIHQKVELPRSFQRWKLK